MMKFTSILFATSLLFLLGYMAAAQETTSNEDAGGDPVLIAGADDSPAEPEAEPEPEGEPEPEPEVNI